MQEGTHDSGDHDSGDQVRAWLRRVMQQTGLKASPLAKAAGLAPSTLLRALDEHGGSSLERASILKIMKTFKVPGPDEAEARPMGFSELELLPYLLQPLPPLEPNQYVKVVNTRALELAGYMIGDLATLDMAATPVGGDAVEAQVYGGGAAHTVFRIYDPPYLVARSADPTISAKPLLVDGDHVRIAAVVVSSVRKRSAPRS